MHFPWPDLPRGFRLLEFRVKFDGSKGTTPIAYQAIAHDGDTGEIFVYLVDERGKCTLQGERPRWRSFRDRAGRATRAFRRRYAQAEPT